MGSFGLPGLREAVPTDLIPTQVDQASSSADPSPVLETTENFSEVMANKTEAEGESQASPAEPDKSLEESQTSSADWHSVQSQLNEPPDEPHSSPVEGRSSQPLSSPAPVLESSSQQKQKLEALIQEMRQQGARPSSSERPSFSLDKEEWPSLKDATQ